MEGDQKKFSNYSYPAMTRTQGSFRLNVEAGEFTDSEILVMLGENGTGEDIICVPIIAYTNNKARTARVAARAVSCLLFVASLCAGPGLDWGSMMGQAHSVL